jgi:DNA-binding sugar fermentation-stimulating protein
MTDIAIHSINSIVEGFIIKRPSQYIKSPYVADVMIGGEEKLAHCPSLGLCGMITEGSLVFMTENTGKTKTQYKVHAVLIKEKESISDKNPTGQVIVGCDPILSNKIGKKLFDKINFFNEYTHHKQEYSYGNSRFDHYYEINGKSVYVEIKSVPTCCYMAIESDSKERKKIYKSRCYQIVENPSQYNRRAVFPDGYKKTKDASVSERANKHLEELTNIVNNETSRACLCLFVMRSDCSAFQPAWQVDPRYNELFNKALDAGVEISVHRFDWRFENNSLVCYYCGTIPIIQHHDE